MNDKFRQLLARRHRLFWKIVLLFWATLFATIVLNIAITQQIVEIESEKRFSDSQIESLTQDAITILESGGNKSFIRWARKQRRESGIHIVLKNEYGQLLFEKFQPPENHSGHAPLPRPSADMLKEMITAGIRLSYILPVKPVEICVRLTHFTGCAG